MEDLMKHIANHLPANVSYNASYFGDYFHETENAPAVRQEGSISLGGTIRSLKDPGAFDSFTSLPYQKDSNMIEGFNFFMIPDYDEVSDYRAEAVELLDDVRTCVEDYFYGDLPAVF
jgi:hypothetical protein